MQAYKKGPQDMYPIIRVSKLLVHLEQCEFNGKLDLAL